ncbi:radical SAM/SPASM domain-containing protein [Arcobacter sp. FWKO B]|uniref:radical SAM protein n=1 Tax=Arcobacter sp. FWKO B TaxID=2593672 RepID=UPI0018A50E76|nr:radical SAM/SPASM domain-containing protein [Arcobacter sp. FWKO B]QOG12177.1 radical SAM protein [Arcobacter sp. FWKO B]
MLDKYAIDSHKLIYHPSRVAKWYESKGKWEGLKELYPIYVEITPIGSCNHRCTFCSVDYIGYKSIKQNEEVLTTRIKEMAKLGVKSIMFAGEGEPTLYKPLPNILDVCSEVGIDTSLTTNAVAMNETTLENYTRNCKWIKVSINAGTKETYAKIHNTKEEDFDKVISNLKLAVKIRKEKNYTCTIGAQLLLLPENKDTVVNLARILADSGIDYLVIKPYTQSLYGTSRIYEGLTYQNMMDLEVELKQYETSEFNIIFRSNTMKKLEETKQPYDKCYATPNFWAYIMADGSVYSCSAFLGNEDFKLGNINDNSFQNIWEGDKRRKNLNFISNDLDITMCRKNCRMDEVNRYLWNLKNPSPHVNFI